MRKTSCLFAVIAWSLHGPATAATQVIVGGTTAILAVSGYDVALTAQPPDAVLIVPSGFHLGSTTGLSTGDSVTSTTLAPTSGIVNFLGNSTVTGMMGVTGQVLNSISGGVGGTTVAFNGALRTGTIGFTAASTMIFNANASGALRNNNFNGTAILGPGVTFTGAATNTTANVGVLTLNSASTYIGAIGDAVNYMNQINLNGNADITGAIASQNIVLGANTLTQVGPVTFPANGQITVNVLSDTAFGNLRAPGSAMNFTSGLQVNMLVGNSVVLSGVPLQIVTGMSGTFGPGSAPIFVTSNNPRFSFIGLNPAGTGNVLVFPMIAPIIGAPPNTFTGPSATGTGSITASFVGGGAGCSFATPQFIGAPPGAAPIPPTTPGPAITFPQGLFDFRAIGCTPGSTITLTITYPNSIDGATYWKYGPTAANPTPHWYVLPATIVGNMATISIADGGLGDDDLAMNGAIVDQGGPGFGPAQIPTLTEWMLVLLALTMLGLGLRHQARRYRELSSAATSGSRGTGSAATNS